MILIKNGTLVSPDGCRRADLLADEGKIVKIAGRIEAPEGCEVKDAAGMLVFPGFIDAHTHFDLHVAGTVTIDDFASGTKAAVAGGTTTIIDFGTAYPGETLNEGLDNWFRKAEAGCSCDYGFHQTITEWNEAISAEIPDMIGSADNSQSIPANKPAADKADRTGRKDKGSGSHREETTGHSSDPDSEAMEGISCEVNEEEMTVEVTAEEVSPEDLSEEITSGEETSEENISEESVFEKNVSGEDVSEKTPAEEDVSGENATAQDASEDSEEGTSGNGASEGSVSEGDSSAEDASEEDASGKDDEPEASDGAEDENIPFYLKW